ncbi:DUF1499 domain-containing protein [Erythrobacter crassostreae]|uniref:DUF1499 domain-containing protein n=1 Tax=Erythrobacter crassostreae TaxID=2828328 RepID=A0A9X1JMV8_9SPHN|nr:DUF1499 domain-containing protein [Erythrobacter crassostrea]MBV7259133.1 DUF1499 domain-containing protein [Erythrobacter crassostrea]
MTALKFVFFGAAIMIVIGVVGFFVLGLSSQNGSAPGLQDGRLAACPSSPNCVSSEGGTSKDKNVEPLPADSWSKLPSVMAAMGGTVTTESDDYIAAEFKSSVFGFVDDIEFRKDGDAVHVRSASRVGHSDAGVNAARVKELRGMIST